MRFKMHVIVHFVNKFSQYRTPITINENHNGRQIRLPFCHSQSLMCALVFPVMWNTFISAITLDI